MKERIISPGLPCAAEHLVPHRPPMLLVSRLVEKTDEVDESVSVIEAVVPESGPFVANGLLLPEYYIEVMAQAIAANDGYPRQEEKKPAMGLLTGIDDFSWTGSAGPGDQLLIRVRKIFEFGAAFIFTGTIHCGPQLIAEGQLKIWKMEE